MEATIQRAFEQSKRIVFLTGAGVSTPSGIPDYRSNNGLYTGHRNAEYYLSHTCLTKEPSVFYDYVKQNLYKPEAKPNVIHEKQAALTQQDRATIITQNIDNLYHQANAKHLVEFHGNLYHVYCQKCHQDVDWQTYLKSPVHANCGGQLRPDVVLYEEGLNEENIANAVNAMSNADLIVIVGTSMRVYPFAGLLDYRNPMAPVIVINNEALSFPFDYQMIQQDAASFFEALQV
ncbi:NAD-dependent deacetylase [Secundilactobacillus odoratitofui DSM 19909 = JCM 15043]|uniref:protein acetyllysine N-acetyltransferase n=1 Tax=Secundilactobacillus odoratitofui DSM 19909 = JCM 15043 TaxID=1423776 RepID=A0A0R1LU90_9LACO|nr:NAD-dependent protein deacylase [Secundilactobacillus odoratitofui]KRK99199.1 NAD-dependent deacetylase [Secundilactobacillus odoratitofui DSM 19909 = JCM 15043]